MQVCDLHQVREVGHKLVAENPIKQFVQRTSSPHTFSCPVCVCGGGGGEERGCRNWWDDGWSQTTSLVIIRIYINLTQFNTLNASKMWSIREVIIATNLGMFWRTGISSQPLKFIYKIYKFRAVHQWENEHDTHPAY